MPRTYTRSCECGKCRKCRNRAQKTQERLTHPERVKARQKRTYEKNAESRRAAVRAYYYAHAEEISARQKIQKQSSEKRNAYNAVYRAISLGQLIPQSCEVCGEDKRGRDGRRLVQAHHEDYARRLDVTWLCSLCHGKRHSFEMLREEMKR